MSRPRATIPGYRRHKASGLAYARLNGRNHYFGRHGTPESKRAYATFVAGLGLTPAGTPEPAPADLTLVELIDRYMDFAAGYYIKGGEPTPHLAAVKIALRRARQLFGEIPAAQFGPKNVKVLRQEMLDRNLSRGYINSQTFNLLRMFKWALSEELLPASTYQTLQALGTLKRGRSTAREPGPIRPVPEHVIEATLPALPAIVADMVRFQRLTGCRPGEVCQLRPMDVDRSRDIWQYNPKCHKTEHHGKRRTVFIGPRAKSLLIKYILDRSPQAFCFSPADSVQRRIADLRKRRKTKVQPSQQNRRKTNPKRKARDRYSKDSYALAIRRGCELAFAMPAQLRRIPTSLPAEERKRLLKLAAEWRREHCWAPNRLRHSSATSIRATYGLEGVQVTLGHAKMDTSEIYAEKNQQLALQIAQEIG